MTLEKAEGNFFDPATEREVLTDQVRDGTHPLLTTCSFGMAMHREHPRRGPPSLYFLPAELGPPRAKGTGP